MESSNSIWTEVADNFRSLGESIRTNRVPPSGIVRKRILSVSPRPFAAGRVKKVRSAVAASRVQFAALLGVTPQTVAAWESGTRKPNKMARRFLTEVESNPVHFRTRLATMTELKLSR